MNRFQLLEEKETLFLTMNRHIKEIKRTEKNIIFLQYYSGQNMEDRFLIFRTEYNILNFKKKLLMDRRWYF